jgi:hypothetical protein
MNKESKPIFHTVSGDQLYKLKVKYYGQGKEVKEGDQICFGFLVNHTDVKDSMSMTLQPFVLDPKGSGMIYQLY